MPKRETIKTSCKFPRVTFWKPRPPVPRVHLRSCRSAGPCSHRCRRRGHTRRVGSDHSWAHHQGLTRRLSTSCLHSPRAPAAMAIHQTATSRTRAPTRHHLRSSNLCRISSSYRKACRAAINPQRSVSTMRLRRCLTMRRSSSQSLSTCSSTLLSINLRCRHLRRRSTSVWPPIRISNRVHRHRGHVGGRRLRSRACRPRCRHHGRGSRRRKWRWRRRRHRSSRPR